MSAGGGILPVTGGGILPVTSWGMVVDGGNNWIKTLNYGECKRSALKCQLGIDCYQEKPLINSPGVNYLYMIELRNTSA